MTIWVLAAFAFGICVGALITAWLEQPKRDSRGRFTK
jgi:hypothetical protein